MHSRFRMAEAGVALSQTPDGRKRGNEIWALFCMNFYEISGHKTRGSLIGTYVWRIPVGATVKHKSSMLPGTLEIKID